MATKVSTSENKVLFGVINWGIGHATRSTVVIDALLMRNFEVHILSNGKALNFLKVRYGNRCEYIEGSNFESAYENGKTITYLRIGFALMKAFFQDSQLLKKKIKCTKYSLFINDCRPIEANLFKGKRFLINHQLTPKWPFWGRFFQKKLDRWQNDFNAVLVPDFEDRILSGVLSENSSVMEKKWLGNLSRLRADVTEKTEGIVLFYGFNAAEVSQQILTDLEEKDIQFRFANKEKDSVQELLAQSVAVISKPGYSSVMELCTINKPILLVDIPWHAEQHSLYRHLINKELFYGTDNLSVQEIVELVQKNPLGLRRSTDRKLLTLTLDTILHEYS